MHGERSLGLSTGSSDLAQSNTKFLSVLAEQNRAEMKIHSWENKELALIH